jgi:pyruvate kinase
MSIRVGIELLKRRRTKMVATLGPASATAERIEAMVDAGVEVFRLNFSHGDHASHARSYELVRAAAKRARVPTVVLADLCGPKIRVGRFDGGQVTLRDGDEVTVTSRDELGRADLIPTSYTCLASDVTAGARLLLDDGRIELRVVSVNAPDVICEVVEGGVLRDHKGLNLPGVAISLPTLTDKDRADAAFALGLGVDLLALSFVRSASDVEDLRTLVSDAGADVGIIAKIEKPEALECIDEIITAADGLLVARGDLGVELPSEMLPIWQEKLVERGRRANLPVIVATEMLDSMVREPRPTRAEIADVSQAVRSGADALMLSAETAIGAYPVDAVRILDRVIRHTEGYQWETDAFHAITAPDLQTRPLPVAIAVGRATAQLSRDLEVRSILVCSRSGASARLVSSARPAAPIMAVSADPRTCRRMNLLWGVIPLEVKAAEMDAPLLLGRRLASELGLAEAGQQILVVRGFHDLPSLSQPTVTVLQV